MALVSLFHSCQWYQATIPMTEWFDAKEWWGKQRLITHNITYFWTVPYLQVFETRFGNQVCLCHHMSGRVPTQLGLFKRATDSVPKMCLKKKQYNVHYPQFTVTVQHAQHLVLSEVTNYICDDTLTQFNFSQVPFNSMSLVLYLDKWHAIGNFTKWWILMVWTSKSLSRDCQIMDRLDVHHNLIHIMRA